jgi:hypothetical protein
MTSKIKRFYTKIMAELTPNILELFALKTLEKENLGSKIHYAFLTKNENTEKFIYEYGSSNKYSTKNKEIICLIFSEDLEIIDKKGTLKYVIHDHFFHDDTLERL